MGKESTIFERFRKKIAPCCSLLYCRKKFTKLSEPKGLGGLQDFGKPVNRPNSPGGQIMPTKLLLAPSDFHTFLRPWAVQRWQSIHGTFAKFSAPKAKCLKLETVEAIEVILQTDSMRSSCELESIKCWNYNQSSLESSWSYDFWGKMKKGKLKW